MATEKKSSVASPYTNPTLRKKILSQIKYAATTKAKQEGKAKGKQFVAQPKSVASKTARYR